jgi:predicted amino acid racemase
MSVPRLEIDLGKLRQNARTLVDQLGARGIAVTGITKATLGDPTIARTLLEAGVRGVGDSRIENLCRLRAADVPGPMTLVRSPMLSQVELVVEHADVSFNTEPAVIASLAAAAAARGRIHGIVLMVELGDLREGILPADLEPIAREVMHLPQLALRGIGTNLACQSGVTPDRRNMAELTALATSIETTLGVSLDVVSGGNSANLTWALAAGTEVGRINDLRLGEAILLGRQPLDRSPLAGLHTDAVTLVAEVIESQVKPSRPWGELAQTAFGDRSPPPDRGPRGRAILALGRQDADPDGLDPPPGLTILGASSDHLVVDVGSLVLAVGDEVRFELDYSALLRAMTSPFVARTMLPARWPAIATMVPPPRPG